MHRESLRTNLAALGYDLAACTDVHDVEHALEAGSVLALVIGAESLPSWLSDRRTDLDGTVTTRVPLVVLSDHDDIETRVPPLMRSAAQILFVMPEDAITHRAAIDRHDRRPFGTLSRTRRRRRQFDASVLRLGAASQPHGNARRRHAGRGVARALHDFTPDVILADLYMPQISGFDHCSRCFAHGPRTAFTPVVLLSGDADMEKRFRRAAHRR